MPPHCFPGLGLCRTVCTPAHTAAIMSLQHPSCSCEHLCPSQIICSRIHSERDWDQHTKSNPYLPVGMSSTLQHASSHLAKKNKQIETTLMRVPPGLVRQQFSNSTWDLHSQLSDPEQKTVKPLAETAFRFCKRQQSLVTTQLCLLTVNKGSRVY